METWAKLTVTGAGLALAYYAYKVLAVETAEFTYTEPFNPGTGEAPPGHLDDPPATTPPTTPPTAPPSAPDVPAPPEPGLLYAGRLNFLPGVQRVNFTDRANDNFRQIMNRADGLGGLLVEGWHSWFEPESVAQARADFVTEHMRTLGVDSWPVAMTNTRVGKAGIIFWIEVYE